MFRRVDAGRDPQTKEEKSWELKALGVASIDHYSEEDFLEYEDLEVIARLFGLYCKEEDPKFNSKYFVPSNHSNFEITE